ncbi:Endonuclease-reverse transcriptase [Popillia japonica]|uniref:Endonuclease-reverse transcriptase n=1 Tax=Popillia japonica TaxID=7064 RepID=A0AAW1MFI1_POPJA
MSAKDVKIAYLRSLAHIGECHFTFWLTVTHTRYGSLNREIKSVCQINDNIELLLDCTKHEISKLWQGDDVSDEQRDELLEEITISFSRNDQEFSVYPHSKDRTIGPVVEAVTENTVEILPDLPSSSRSCILNITENTVEILPDLPSSSIQTEYRNSYTQHKLGGKNLRVVSYNILADRYTDDKFAYCDPRYLSIDYRKQVILNEIINYKADIICMQEVGMEEYKDFFKDQFKNNDYISAFFKKGNMIPEGLAVVFDRNRFKKIDCSHIVFSKEVRHNLYRDIWSLMKKYKDVKELFLKQHTSLLVTILKLVETGDILVIANTHLYYHYEAGHIRLLQIAMALKYIKQRINHIQSKEIGNVSVIFCGDFNSRPETAVYQLLSCGEINQHEENLDCIGGPKSNVFRHNFKFVSACGTPEFTNYTEDFKGCLDYIFCQNNVEITQVVPFPPVPPEEELATDTALPNKYFPSDHIALVADLKL